MPTVVDSLVLTLGLDASNYKAGQQEFQADLKKTKEQANQTAKDLEASGKRAAEFFSQIKTEALSLIGILLGGKGLETFTRDATNSMAALARAAANAGATVPQLGAFLNVIERNGGSAQAATNSLQGLMSVMQNIRTFGGNSQFFGFLGPIGGSATDTPLEIVEKYLHFIETHKDQIALQNQIGRGLGFDQDTINSLRQVGTLSEFMRQFNVELQRTPTKEMTQQAQELQKAWLDLQHQGEFLGETILTKVSPALESVAKWITQLLKDQPDVAFGLSGIAGTLAAIAALNFSSVVGFLTRLAPLLGVGASLGWLYLENAAKQQEFEDAAKKLGFAPTETSPLNPIPDFVGPNGERLTWEEMARRLGPPYSGNVGGGGWLEREFQRLFGGGSPAVRPTADASMAPEQRAFLDTIAAPESGGDYGARNPHSTAHGRYQFLNSTDTTVSDATGIYGEDPVSQDRKAWYLASTTYSRSTGRDLLADLKAGGHEQQIADALKDVWPSLPGGSQNQETMTAFVRRLHDGIAAYGPQQRQTQPAAPPPSGSGGPQAPAQPPPPSAPAAAPRVALPFDPSFVLGASRPLVQPSSLASATTSIQVSGPITINTQASDARGIARDFASAVVAQANRGLA